MSMKTAAILYADSMLMGIIKQYIADYDEELVKWEKSVKPCSISLPTLTMLAKRIELNEI